MAKYQYYAQELRILLGERHKAASSNANAYCLSSSNNTRA